MKAYRIVHASDFHHDGSPELREALSDLLAAAADRRPDLMVVTGDLSANGRAEELDAVASALDRLGAMPRVILPGNRDLVASAGPPGEAHLLPQDSDLDYFLALEPVLSFGFEEVPSTPAGAPGTAFLDRFGELEPAYADDRLHLAAVNSTPRIRTDSLARAARRLRRAPAGAIRVFGLHHGLLGVPGRKVRDGDLSHRAGDVLSLVLDLGVDLVLHGHLHRAHAWQVSDGHHAVVVAGAGALVNDGRRDASFLEIDIDAARMTIRRRTPGGGAETIYEGERSGRGSASRRARRRP